MFVGSEYLLKKDNGATLLDITGGHFFKAMTYILGPVGTISATAVVQHTSSQVVNPDGTPTGDVIPVDSPSQVAVSGTLKSGAMISLHWRTGLEMPSNVKAATPLLWVIDGTKGSIRIESDHPFALLWGCMSLRSYGSTARRCRLKVMVRRTRVEPGRNT